MDKVRWGVLSTAMIARDQQIPAIQRADNAEVKAIASLSGLEKASEVADSFGIEKAYDSYEKLLADGEIDAVYIPLPNHLHKEWVIKAAEHGKHVLCEKPAALDEKEAQEMIDACRENDVLFMEAFMYHFHPQHEKAREIIGSGEIGGVKLMRAAFSFQLNEKSNIRYRIKDGGGSMYDIGCYTVHTIRNILKSEPISVQAHTVIDREHGVDTDVAAYLEFPDGVRGIFDVSFGMAFRSEYEVIGTKGKIFVPRAYRPDNQGGEGLIHVESQEGSRTVKVGGDAYRSQVEHLSAVILDRSLSLLHTNENTLLNMRVMDGCFASAESGEKVLL